MLSLTASAVDSSDCLSEYNNATSEQFCNICTSETGASPLRDRCSLCASKCPSTADTAICAIDGAESADAMLDSLIYIWAAAERCDKSGMAGSAVQCSVDVSSAIESVNHMINFILKAVQKCGGALQGEHAKCGMVVGELTDSLAGIAATSSGIAEHCPKDVEPPLAGTPAIEMLPQKSYHKFARCIIDLKSLLKSVLKATARIMMLQKQTSGTYNVLQVVDAFAAMGQYIAGAVGHCSEAENEAASCASEVIGLVKQLGSLSSAGEAMSRECSLSSAQRLYLDKPMEIAISPLRKYMNIGLVIMMPFAGVGSYLAGRRVEGATRRVNGRTLSRIPEAQEMLANTLA